MARLNDLIQMNEQLWDFYFNEREYFPAYSNAMQQATHILMEKLPFERYEAHVREIDAMMAYQLAFLKDNTKIGEQFPFKFPIFEINRIIPDLSDVPFDQNLAKYLVLPIAHFLEEYKKGDIPEKYHYIYDQLKQDAKRNCKDPTHNHDDNEPVH